MLATENLMAVEPTMGYCCQHIEEKQDVAGKVAFWDKHPCSRTQHIKGSISTEEGMKVDL